ncbi:Uncharacterized protein dnm_055450 [Desulfonema magnum]|uniref:Uncharacterized protein n=1 Tax=Desulfonema magnum TaxID=45655 RepID=A0A975GQ44_9BACT|nr:Uncharacterized protein dnm_055450 [Desulfonema magnum]
MFKFFSVIPFDRDFDPEQIPAFAEMTGFSSEPGQKISDYNGFRGKPSKPCKGAIFVAAQILFLRLRKKK